MPRGLSDAPPETPVWDWLDRLGVPFRETVGALVAANGTAPSDWTDSFRECRLPSKPIARAASPFVLQWREGDDPTLPPYRLDLRLRGALRGPADLIVDRRAERNLAELLRALRPRLGPGEDASVSNTHARRWSCGMARVEAMCFPPRLNRRRGRNRRHEIDPGAAVEALLIVHPGWLPEPGPLELGWLAAFSPLLPVMAPFFGLHSFPPRWNRWRTDLGRRPPDGCGPSHDGKGFVAVAGEFFLTLPRAALLRVERSVMSPARGSGCVELSLFHGPPGVPVRAPHEFLIARDGFGSRILKSEAESLARALDLPLTEYSGLDS